MSRILYVLTLMGFLLITAAPDARADWMRFRGPNGSGIELDSAKTPVKWNDKANLKWKIELPGMGVSSPIVVGDRAYVTCYSGYGMNREAPGDQKNLKRHLVSVDIKSGKILWDRTVDAVLPEDPYEGIGVPGHGYASNSPVSDGENIYVFFGKTGALGFSKDGQQLWQTNVGKESDPRRWGTACSPIVYKNLLIVPAAAESEAMVALDTKSGKEVWRQEAAGLANTWSTPLLVPVDEKRTDLVMTTIQEVWGLNPETGKLRWFCEGAKARSFSSSPVSSGDVVYAIEGQSGVAMAVRAGGKGDVTKSHVVWTGRDKGRFCSPIVHDGHLYSFANGVISVMNAKTGERVNRKRLEGAGGGGMGGGDYASPILADGKFYMVRRSGETHVLSANPELESLAVNKVTNAKEDFSGTPAVHNGGIIIRSDKHLYCVADLGHEVPESALASADAATEENEGNEAGGGRERGRRGEGGRRGGRRRFDPEAMFKENDADKDGKLTKDELPERMQDRMDQLDADKDGAVTLQEFQDGTRRMFGRRGGRGGNPREGKPDRPQRPELES
ncbi:MAG: outer membrane protein assembly factor BamB family protein [Planctomycetota bacterium]|jgi:outer membrane protein assembly factor BamB